MEIMMRLRHLPVRLATGAFILDSGINHTNADEQTAGQVHSMASGTYPFFFSLDPRTCTRLLGFGEAALGLCTARSDRPSVAAWGGSTG
jgi:hypothetical protein